MAQWHRLYLWHHQYLGRRRHLGRQCRSRNFHDFCVTQHVEYGNLNTGGNLKKRQIT
jgi:hypothetical protein